MSIKVANIILESRWGGPQSRILQVAERLKKYGIETVVIIPKNDSEEIFYQKLKRKNITVERFFLHRLTKNVPHLIACILFFPIELYILYKFIKRSKISIVHCNSAWQLKGVIAGRLAGAKVIWHLNDTYIPLPLKLAFKVLANLCDGFIVAGAKVKNYYLSNFSSKPICIIPPPVDTSIFNPEKVKPDKRIISYRGIKIGTIANVNPTKGLEYFVEMCKLLNQKYDNLKFFIIGAELKSQKKYAKRIYGMVQKNKISNLFFYGRADDVPGVLKALDIFVCSSVTEAGPMSVWEAMAMEKAIVSTDVGDVAQFIIDGENGFVAPVGNPKLLAEKVGFLIENPQLRMLFGKKVRQVACENLDIEICVKKHYEFYRKILAI